MPEVTHDRLQLGPLTPADFLTGLEADVAAITEHLLCGDLMAAVPACPGWDLGDLGSHLGVTHRWATAALSSSTPPDEEPPPGRGELPEWFAEGGRRLVRALRDVDPDQPCWGFGPKPRTAAFWLRRQAHETSVHAWDAASALGSAARIDARLAADGVDEVATMFYPRQVRLGRREPLGTAVTLTCSDVGSTVVLGEGEPVAEVRAAAELLQLGLWRRLRLADLIAAGAVQVIGDERAAVQVLGEPLVP